MKKIFFNAAFLLLMHKPALGQKKTGTQNIIRAAGIKAYPNPFESKIQLMNA